MKSGHSRVHLSSDRMASLRHKASLARPDLYLYSFSIMDVISRSIFDFMSDDLLSFEEMYRSHVSLSILSYFLSRFS